MARPMACARGGPGVATLADGRIMVTDLVEPGCGVAEIYDPATGSFTKTGSCHRSTSRPSNGRGFTRMAGASPGSGRRSLSGTAEPSSALQEWMKHGQTIFRSFRFHPATNRWTQFGPTAAARSRDTETKSKTETTRSWS